MKTIRFCIKCNIQINGYKYCHLCKKKRIKEYCKKWHLRNYKKREKRIIPQEIIEKRKEKRREYVRAYYKIYYKKNISQKIALIFRQRLWRLLKGRKVKFKMEELIGCSKKYLKKYIENKFKQNMTWNNHGKWHIDHIKPCVSFNLEYDNELKKCFHYTNLQPLWAKDNIIKGSKIIK